MGLHCDANRNVATRDFFDSQTVGEKISARATIFFREWQTQQAQLSHFANNVIRKGASGSIFFAIGFFFFFAKSLQVSRIAICSSVNEKSIQCRPFFCIYKDWLDNNGYPQILYEILMG